MPLDDIAQMVAVDVSLVHKVKLNLKGGVFFFVD